MRVTCCHEASRAQPGGGVTFNKPHAGAHHCFVQEPGRFPFLKKSVLKHSHVSHPPPPPTVTHPARKGKCWRCVGRSEVPQRPWGDRGTAQETSGLVPPGAHFSTMSLKQLPAEELTLAPPARSELNSGPPCTSTGKGGHHGSWRGSNSAWPESREFCS